MWYIFLTFIALALFYIYRDSNNKEKWLSPSEKFSPQWKDILIRNVCFYNSLSDEEKNHFEFKIQVDALTKDVSLIITDFAEKDEIEESKMLWEKQIAVRILNSNQ